MSGRSFRTHRRDSLLGERFHLVLGNRLSVGLGEALPEEVRHFVFGQLAVFVGVGRGEERIEMRSGPTLGNPRPTAPATATVPAKSVSPTSLSATAVMTLVSGKGTSAPTTAMSKALMTGKTVATASVTGERVVPEAVMPTSRETVA